MSGNADESDLISKLFTRYRQMMYNKSFAILRDSTEAEDVVQDAFLRIIKNFEKISRIPCWEMGFYFVTITEHLSISAVNKKNRHPTEDIDGLYDIASKKSLEESAGAALLTEEIIAALENLSHRDYSIMYLHVFKEMTPKEIAQELDISERNIYTYIDRARKRLIKILNERGIYYDF